MNTRGSNERSLGDVPSLLMAAHELKAPLVLIRQLTLQLEEGFDQQANERIRLTAERSLRLVESLTRTARLQDGLFPTEPITIGALYNDVAHELYPLAKALGQGIVVDIPNRPMTVVANSILIRSVLIGLCDNALTHNSTDNPVRLSAKRQGDRVELGVRDYGPHTGNLKHISRQVGQTLAPLDGRPRSSGLGLLIAKQFADQMEADLTLIRHRQAGATFSLIIPESKQLSLI